MKKKLKIAALSILIVFLAALLLATFYIIWVVRDSVLDDTLLPKESAAAIFFDIDGGRMTSGKTLVKSEEIPKNLKNAFIAMEDKRFYKHNGFDIRRMAGAGVNNIKTHRMKEGASTISQQLIKNTHLSQEKTYKRKFKEIKLATELEKHYSKDEILTMYLNAIYFGKGIYGAGAAAKRFFDKDVKDLTLAECATLAGVVKNPSAYSPLANAENSSKRKNLVLKLMREQGYINDEEYSSASAELVRLAETKVSEQNVSPSAMYLESAESEALSILGITKNQLNNLGYKIYTYYDPEVQALLEETAAADEMSYPNKSGYRPDICAVLADNATGGISAYYSNRYRPENIRRQSGSVLKPLAVYAPALERGVITAATPLLDEKTDFSGFSPKNYNEAYYGWTTARQAVAKSMNVPAVKVLTYLGVDNSAAFLSRLKITTSDGDKNLALALGSTSKGISATELLGGYLTLSCGGQGRRAAYVKSIIKDGEKVYANDNLNERIISPETAYIMTDILRDTVRCGTAKALSALGIDVAAKTGTVGSEAGNSDAWCISYTALHTLLVWHGNGTGAPDRVMSEKETGGSYPAAAAREVFRRLYPEGVKSFERPAGIVEKDIDLYSLKINNELALASELTPAKYRLSEIFSLSNMPSKISSVFDDIGAGLSAEYKNNVVELSFSAREFVSYDIVKIVEISGETITYHLATVSDKNGEIKLTDYVFPRNNYITYELRPTLVLGNDKIAGQPSSVKIYAEFNFDDFNFDFHEQKPPDEHGEGPDFEEDLEDEDFWN